MTGRPRDALFVYLHGWRWSNKYRGVGKSDWWQLNLTEFAGEYANNHQMWTDPIIEVVLLRTGDVIICSGGEPGEGELD